MTFSEACERNKVAIGQVLIKLVTFEDSVLEIGTGTAQHAVYFTQQMPSLRWQCSDLPENLLGIRARIKLEGGGRLPSAIELDVMSPSWPDGPFDAVFTANTLHIMPWSHTPVLLRRSEGCLKPGGCLIIYGPFHDDGIHTAPSNEAFDRSLNARDPAMGVRDALQVKALAAELGLLAEADLALPANNRILVFRKSAAVPA